ncbi:hypothetical protein ACOMHN_049352 [Nucella lapillus]
MLSRPVVTVGLVAMVLSSVLCASLLSHTDRSLSETRCKREVMQSQAELSGYISYESDEEIPTAILLILEEKCQDWQDSGAINLPRHTDVGAGFLAEGKGGNVQGTSGP